MNFFEPKRADGIGKMGWNPVSAGGVLIISCRQRRELRPATKGIMVTRVNDFESIEKAQAQGAVDYVTKPFTVDYLAETVAARIAKHLIFA